MTKQVKHQDHIPESNFKSGIRNNKRLDSSRGFVLFDIDLFYRNYKTGKFIFVEEKCRYAEMDWSQQQNFHFLDQQLKHSPYYLGFFLVQFSSDGPENSNIFLNDKLIDINQLEKFLLLEDENLYTAGYSFPLAK